MSRWSEENIERARALAAGGSSAAKAAAEFGCSRSAMLGLGHRNGFQFKSGEIKRALGGEVARLTVKANAQRRARKAAVSEAARVKPTNRKPIPNATPAQMAERRAEIAAEALAADPVSESATAILFRDLNSLPGQCRFPLWGKGAYPHVDTAMVCGAPATTDGRGDVCSWCERHFAIVTAPARGSLSDGAIKQSFRRAK